MNPIYVADFVYCPDVGTFRGTRGAWKVRSTYVLYGGLPNPTRALLGLPVPATKAIFAQAAHVYPPSSAPVRVLRMTVPRQLMKGAWANPTALLRELFARPNP